MAQVAHPWTKSNRVMLLGYPNTRVNYILQSPSTTPAKICEQGLHTSSADANSRTLPELNLI